MSDMKYLSDGRKVAVVGQINQTEYIVQEIFITEDGDEIPSGEKFTAKSLHSKPVESYSERRKREIEKQVKDKELQLEGKTRKLRSLEQEIKAYSEIVKNNRLLTELMSEEQLEVFSQFVTGNIEYLVVKEYNLTPPVKLIDKIIDFETRYRERYFDSIRLLSVMGRSGGDLAYRINRYSDGSGSSTEVFPFTNYEDAVSKIKELAIEKVNKGYLSDEDIEAINALGITFNEEINKKIIEIKTKTAKSNIESAEKQIADSQKRINENQKTIKKIKSNFDSNENDPS